MGCSHCGIYVQEEACGPTEGNGLYKDPNIANQISQKLGGIRWIFFFFPFFFFGGGGGGGNHCIWYSYFNKSIEKKEEEEKLMLKLSSFHVMKLTRCQSHNPSYSENTN